MRGQHVSHRLVFLFFLLVIGGCRDVVRPDASTPIPVEAVPTIDPDDSALAAGQRNYNVLCAHCHGYGGEGQPIETVEQTETLGYHTVPFHNAAGHTWEHPDQILFQTIKFGVEAPTDLYPMPGFGENLSDDEILGVIDYMRLWWTEDQQAWQRQVTAQFAEDNPYWEATYLGGE